MRRAVAVLALTLGCEATSPPRAEPAAPPADDPEHVATPEPPRPEPEPAPEPAVATRAPVPLCVRMCERQGQARAVGPDVITRECTARCSNPAGVPAECDAFARQARDRVEAVPMQKRAARVWAELAKPAFYCGYSDPLTRGLSAAASQDRAQRKTALEAALASDPFGPDACPTGADLDDAATAADAIDACALEEAPSGWQSDVDAATYLSMRAVRVRLEALSLHEGDRKILLQTLVLSTALAAED
ncbi:MAG: hypothetical protein ACE37F_04535 [Nannocystaceae bacterium]|nr:hypothetical protein [bacterium]